METIDIINKIIKIIFINNLSFFVWKKLINYKENNYFKTIIIVCLSIVEAFIELKMQSIPTLLRIIGMYFIYGIILAKITKKPIYYTITIFFISLTITYIMYIISIIFAGIIVKVLNLSLNINNTLIFILTILIEVIIMSLIFKIRRFKNGIPFLQNEHKVGNIGVIGIVFIGIALIVYSFIQDTVHTKYIFFGMIIELICLFIWLKRKITVYYRQRLKEKTVEELESEIRAKDERICEVVDENSKLAEINHKFCSRIRALEDFSCKVIERPEVAELMRCEFGDEFADFEEAVKNVSEEFSSEMKNTIIIQKNLPKTGVFGVDNLLEYMCKESAKNGIDFDVKINGNILFMVQKIIDSKMLETLLGDHIKDAIIAINSSQNTYKNILVTIGIVKECYEISIYDTGIEFEIDTLLKLGLERITTHKNTGRKRNRIYDNF